MWTTYIATDDIEATAAAVAGNGGTVLQAPMDILDAGRMIGSPVPDGAVAGAWQAGTHTGAAFVTEPGGQRGGVGGGPGGVGLHPGLRRLCR